MICSDYGSTRYYIPDIKIGALGFIVDSYEDNADEIIPVKLVSYISKSKDPEAYEMYFKLDETRNDYMEAERSCMFILSNGSEYVVGLDPLEEKDLKITHYC